MCRRYRPDTHSVNLRNCVYMNACEKEVLTYLLSVCLCIEGLLKTCDSAFWTAWREAPLARVTSGTMCWPTMVHLHVFVRDNEEDIRARHMGAFKALALPLMIMTRPNSGCFIDDWVTPYIRAGAKEKLGLDL